MIQTDFCQEVVKSGLFDGDFIVVAEEFAKYQNKAMDTLKELHRVCVKDNVRYQLAYGSLLGAIREGGQIPWDYDIDVFIPCEDRQKFLEAIKKDMSKDFYVYSPETNKECRHFISRIAPKGFDTQYLHVDVFYLAGCKENNCTQIQKRIKNLTLLYKAKHFRMTDSDAKSKRELLIMMKNRIAGIFDSNEAILNEYHNITLDCKLKEANYLISADRFADWYKFQPDLFDNMKILKTKDGEFFIPNNYDKVLTQIYGDYMKLPPLEVRLKEMIRHYKYLKNNCPL